MQCTHCLQSDIIRLPENQCSIIFVMCDGISPLRLKKPLDLVTKLEGTLVDYSEDLKHLKQTCVTTSPPHVHYWYNLFS